jgi:hypothetical protein
LHADAPSKPVKGRNIMIDYDFSSNAEALVALLLAAVIVAVTFV